jgi:DNA topoisomerase I
MSVDEEETLASMSQRMKDDDDDNRMDDYEDYEEEMTLSQLRNKKKEKKKKKRSKKPKASSSSATAKGKKTKQQEKGKKGKKEKEKEEEEEKYEWWQDDKVVRPEGHKWVALSHNGVLFPPEYTRHNVPLLYDGKEVVLAALQEEYCTYFSTYFETAHMEKPQFSENFFADFKEHCLKGTAQRKVIRKFELCDFSRIRAHVLAEREARKARSAEEKAAEKAEREAMVERYGYAMVDGVRERVANFRVEPPGLFLGRGNHPLAGRIKLRVTPNQVTLNLSESAPVPEGDWLAVVHNPKTSWLAFWRENIRSDFKYVWLHAGSRIKGESDRKKFDVARRLGAHIGSIRGRYRTDLASPDARQAQLATALWVIDRLALRVGNEKGEFEADTVGCCSLRVEHIKLLPGNKLKLRFLGKDSMLYERTCEVERRIWLNFQRFCKHKKRTDGVFDRLTTGALNAHLKDYMPGLTAKVFRTFNASSTLETELAKVDLPPDVSVEQKVLEFNRANREVAILCNHQRSMPPTHVNQIERLDREIEELQARADDLRRYGKLLKRHKGDHDKAAKQLNSRYWRPFNSDKDPDDAKVKRLRLPKSGDTIEKSAARIEERMKVKQIRRTGKEELKTVALGTSKINYIDPRITVRWCRENNVDVAKVFAKTLRDKFAWAIATENIESYVFFSDKDRREAAKQLALFDHSSDDDNDDDEDSPSVASDDDEQSDLDSGSDSGDDVKGKSKGKGKTKSKSKRSSSLSSSKTKKSRKRRTAKRGRSYSIADSVKTRKRRRCHRDE